MRSINALVHMIHAYDIDVNELAQGIIPPGRYGNGDQELRSQHQLLAEDLINFAMGAREFGHLGKHGKLENMFCLFAHNII